MKKNVLLGEPGGKAVGGAALPGARPAHAQAESHRGTTGWVLLRLGCGEEKRGIASALVTPMPETSCFLILLFQFVMVSKDLCGTVTGEVESQNCNCLFLPK